VALGGDPARFRMLETLRGYAAERLAEAGEAELVAARHTAWFVALAETAARHRTARPGLRAVDADHDNVRAVMDRAIAADDHVTALRIGGALGWYWMEHHTDEGRRRLCEAVALAAGRPPSLHLAHALLATSIVDLERFPTLPRIAEDARRSFELFERFGDPVGAATAKVVLAQAAQQQSGPRSDGPSLVAAAEAAFTAAGDRWGEAFAALNSLSVDSARLAVPGRAEAAAQQALERFESLDDQWGRALATYILANLARGRGQVDTAIGHYEQAITAAREDGPLWARCACLVELGGLVAMQGDVERATALHAEAVTICRRTGWRRGLAYTWNGLGAIARARGDLERARELHREALAIVREEVGWSVPYTLAQLGCAEARLGELEPAERDLAEAARLVLDAFEPVSAAVVLVGRALVELGHGYVERSALLLAAADAVRDRAGLVPVGAELAETILVGEAVRDRLDPDVLDAAQAAGRELDADAALRLILRRVL
jgi:tetratricopeptide (TPR) repeat protein